MTQFLKKCKNKFNLTLQLKYFLFHLLCLFSNRPIFLAMASRMDKIQGFKYIMALGTTSFYIKNFQKILNFLIFHRLKSVPIFYQKKIIKHLQAVMLIY